MILTFDSVNWFTQMIRPFFGAIDWLIYSLIGWIMEGIFNLSNLMIDPAFVKNVYNRVYVIIAIFMVFKLAFSFLKYMVSPDSLTDKNDGIGKLVVRAITMLAILIFLPVIFFNQDLIGEGRGPVLTVLQSGLIKTVPKIVLGIDDGTDNTDGTYTNSVVDKANEYGEAMAVNMLSAFFFPEECRKNEDSNTCTADTKYIESIDDFLDKINEHNFADDTFNYQYMWPLTTVAGVLLILTLVGMAIEIAIRTFKLIILQMMAPIPVMTYIDPKSSKDGAFSSWLKTFVSTYIDIFIKLATIYLLLLLVSKVFAGDGNSIFKNTAQGFMSKNLVMVFLVIGLFKFAKEAPQFIKDALGIKSKGGSGFGFGKTLAAAGGALVGGAAGLAGGYSAAKAGGASTAGALLRAAGGGAAGLFRGGSSALSAAGKDGKVMKGLGAAAQAQANMNQRKVAAAAAGSTMLGRMGSKFDSLFTGQTKADKDKQNIDNYKDAIDKAKNFKTVLSDSAAKSDDALNVNGLSGVNLKQFKGTLAAANAGDKNAIKKLAQYGFGRTVTTTTTDASGRTITTSATVGDLSAANAGAAKFEKDWQNAYYDAIINDNIKADANTDAVMSAKSLADSAIKSLDLTDRDGNSITEVNASTAGAVQGAATIKINNIQQDSSYKANKANADFAKKGK